jgi:hypothetical protein
MQQLKRQYQGSKKSRGIRTTKTKKTTKYERINKISGTPSKDQMYELWIKNQEKRYKFKGIDSKLNKIIAEIFSNLEKEMVIQVQMAFRTPNRQDQKTNTPRQLFKYTEQEILKTSRQKQQVTYKGKPTRTTADFSTETLIAMKSWNDIVQPLKENNCQPR